MGSLERGGLYQQTKTRAREVNQKVLQKSSSKYWPLAEDFSKMIVWNQFCEVHLSTVAGLVSGKFLEICFSASEASQNHIQRLHNAMSLFPTNSSAAFCCRGRILNCRGKDGIEISRKVWKGMRTEQLVCGGNPETSCFLSNSNPAHRPETRYCSGFICF